MGNDNGSGNGKRKRRSQTPRWNFCEWKRFIDSASDNNDRGKHTGFVSLMPKIDFLKAYRHALTLRDRFDAGLEKEKMLDYIDKSILDEEAKALEREKAW